jgi:signal transduction histidine kinase
MTSRTGVRDSLARVRVPSERAVDVGLFVFLTAVGIAISVQPDSGDSGWIATVLVPAVTLPVLVRREHPLAAACALVLGVAISGIPSFDQIRCGFALPVAALIGFSAAARLPLSRALLALAALFVAMGILVPTDKILNDGSLEALAFVLPTVAGIWALGRVAHSRDLVAAALAERMESLRAQREQTAALAVELERTRLSYDLDAAARERIHEIVDVALAERNGGGPIESRAAFAQIETNARAALNDMRGLLGALRSDERPTHSSRPTLDEIDALLEEARWGEHVPAVEIAGEPRPLPGSIELAAYRVIQHFLTAVQPDAADPPTVRIRYLDEAVELEVRGAPKDGSQARAAMAALRERVDAHGGSVLERESGGCHVLRASLPVAAHA